MVVPVDDGSTQSLGLKWEWNGITPICMDDNKCRYRVPRVRSLMQKTYPFSEERNGEMVSQFTYNGEVYKYSERTDSEGALIYTTRGVPLDIPIVGQTTKKNQHATPRRYRVFSFSDNDGFRDIEDFDPTLALINRINDDRHMQTASIHGKIPIPSSAGISSATSWELRMDITVIHSTNATFFKTVGWAPGGYSGIQQTPDTSKVPSGKNFVFSMWGKSKTNLVHAGEINKEADLGGKIGVLKEKFGGEGTGMKTQIDFPWAIGDTSTVVIRGSQASVNSMDWCVTSELAPAGKDKVFLSELCRNSQEDPLADWGFGVFIEDWLKPVCSSTLSTSEPTMNFKVQRAAIFSNWKVVVDGDEVETAAPEFYVNTNDGGYARGLTDAGMLSDNAFFLSTGGWKYDTWSP